MKENRKASINVANNITNGYYVSTAMWATEIPATGMRHPTYETIIWEWKDKKRGSLLKTYYHIGRVSSLEFHFRFCRTLAWRQLYKEMENDNPYVDMDRIKLNN